MHALITRAHARALHAIAAADISCQTATHGGGSQAAPGAGDGSIGSSQPPGGRASSGRAEHIADEEALAGS